MLEHALAYIERGWAVLPLHTVADGVCSCSKGAECTSPGKHPRLRAGVTEASTDEATVRQWWSRWPEANVGIATGAPSGVWVLDIDHKAPPMGCGGYEAWDDWRDEHGEVEAPCVRTGSLGAHYWFRMPSDDGGEYGDVRNRQHLKHAGVPSGINVRGTGGYVVAPPSVHASGRSYSWVDYDGTEVGLPAPEAFALAPDWLMQKVCPPRPVHAPAAYEAPERDPATREQRYAYRVLDRALEAIYQAPEGGRHELLNRQAYAVGGYAHLLGGVDGLVQPFVDAFLAATGDPKREREARRTAFDGLTAGAQRPREVPNRDGYEDRPADASWSGSAELPDDEDIPVDTSWWEADLDTMGGQDGRPSAVAGVEHHEQSTEDEVTTLTAARPADGTAQQTEEQRRTTPGRQLPVIRVNQRQMQHVLADAWSAVRSLPASRGLYQQDGRLVRILQTESGPRVEPVDSGWLTATLVQAARWVKLRKATGKDLVAAGETWVETDTDRLPSYLVSSMVGAPHPKLPVLERIERAPYVGPDGRVVSDEGYRADTRTYLGPTEPPIRMSLDEARDLLREWLGDFPFARQHDWAHALGFLVTPVVRSMIPGPCPVHVFEAPQRGTGKTLLMEVISRVSAGYAVAASKLASNDEERRKSLVAHLLAGSSIVLLDNVTGRVDDDTLAGILTAYPRYADRRMGGQSLIWAPARAVWALSGNNMTMSTDIARRAVVVRLDAKMERPEQRAGFAIRDLRRWTEANAGRLRSAVLTMVEHWVALGCPDGAGRLGSYESWSRVVGGIVSEVTDGWLCGREDRLRDADPEREDWRRLIRIWLQSSAGSKYRRSSMVWELCDANDLLLDVRGDGSKQSQYRKLAHALNSMRGVVIEVDGHQREILPGPKRQNAATWHVSGEPSAGNVLSIEGGPR